MSQLTQDHTVGKWMELRQGPRAICLCALAILTTVFPIAVLSGEKSCLSVDKGRKEKQGHRLEIWLSGMQRFL